MTSPPLTDLPVELSIGELRAALGAAPGAVLVAEPGAGKTTIAPLRLLQEPWLDGKRILLLEPRRVAARAAARRLSYLLGETPGGTVGLVTRDERVVGSTTRLTVVTEGVLTRRLQHDPTLPGVGLVIFDEYHERSLQADLGLALTLDIQAGLRPDLKVLVMSATIDAPRVASLVAGDEAEPDAVPIVQSPGRTHPIDVRWVPRRQRDRLEPAVASAVRSALRESGDVLVFLPGMAEIRRCADAIEAAGFGADVDLRLLHGSLPSAEQDHALEPSPPGRRKVVLSTDVAESSLTVEGVRVVIDAGLARVPRFDSRTGMTRLVTVSASKASAEQRAGRAGRTAPGVAIRLWSKIEHAGRPPHTAAEITQVDLTGLALELAVWGVTEPHRLRFLDPPPKRSWDEATALLGALGALDEHGRPTELGRDMGGVPIHPRLARMLVAAASGPHAWTACLVAAVLDDRDVLRGRPNEVPADLALRLELLDDPRRHHPQADGRALRRARDRAHDLARRLDITSGTVEPEAAGSLLLSAFPDRVATRRGPRSRGRFVLRTGGGAWVEPTDPLADAELVVAADLDGKRTEARIRLAAALDPLELMVSDGDRVTESVELVWDAGRNDLVLRTERRLDGLRLGTHDEKPIPGETTRDALLDHVRDAGIEILGWDRSSISLRRRLAFLHRHVGAPWPDLSDDALLAELDDWLAPFLIGATGRRELAGLDMTMVLRARMSWDQGVEVDDLAPESIELPTGRRARIDYEHDPPVLAVRVQELFGCSDGPRILGDRLPVVLHLLSPADRPVQITTDLAGFWSGSWHDVRKDLAGRYPKHAWPADPASTPPHRR